MAKKTQKFLDRRGNVACLDIKYTGEEPTWTDAENILAADYYKRRDKGFYFYNYYLDCGQMRPWVLDWMKKNGYKKDQIDAVKSAPAWYVPSTVGKLVRMLQRGMPDLPQDADKHYTKMYQHIPEEERPKPIAASEHIHDMLKEALHNIFQYETKTAAASLNSPNAPTKSPFQRLQEKIDKEILVPLETILDDMAAVTKETTPAAMPNIDLSSLLRAHSIPANGVKPIIEWLSKHYDWMKEAYDKTCDQMVETYSWLSRPQLKRAIDNFEKMIQDVRNHARIKNSVRKTRTKKPKAADKQVSKLKYLEQDTDYALKSVDPTKIPFAQRLYTFNSKYRQLTVYYANNHDGFAVKGSTLNNFDADNSITISLRKPNDILPIILSGAPKKIDAAIASLKTKPKKANGRINTNTILLKVLDTR